MPVFRDVDLDIPLGSSVALVGASVGPAAISPGRTMLEVLDRLPLIEIDSGLDARQAAIVWELRLPRVAVDARRDQGVVDVARAEDPRAAAQAIAEEIATALSSS